MNENVLKAIVIGLAVLIVLTLGVLIYAGFVGGESGKRAPQHVYQQNFDIPAGYIIAAQDFSGDYLILTLRKDSEASMWFIVDLDSGSVVGKIRASSGE